MLPESHSQYQLFNILAQDIVTNLLLYPAIDTLADPDFINTRYINIIKKYGKDRQQKESPETSSKQWIRFQNYSDYENCLLSPGPSNGEELCFENILILINLSNSSTDEETLKQVFKLLRLNIETVAGLGGDSTENDRTHENHWLEIMAELTKAKTICQTKLDDFQCTLHEDDDLDVNLGSFQSRILKFVHFEF